MAGMEAFKEAETNGKITLILVLVVDIEFSVDRSDEPIPRYPLSLSRPHTHHLSAGKPRRVRFL